MALKLLLPSYILSLRITLLFLETASLGNAVTYKSRCSSSTRWVQREGMEERLEEKEAHGTNESLLGKSNWIGIEGKV